MIFFNCHFPNIPHWKHYFIWCFQRKLLKKLIIFCVKFSKIIFQTFFNVKQFCVLLFIFAFFPFLWPFFRHVLILQISSQDMIFVEKLSFFKIHVSDIIIIVQNIVFQRPRKHDFFNLPILNFSCSMIFFNCHFPNNPHWNHYFIWYFQCKLLQNWSFFVSNFPK